MNDQEKTPPFYEHRWFQGAVALIGLAAAIWGLAGAPKPWQVASDLAATELPPSNTEIVLDASEAMADSFEDKTKLEAAAGAIESFAIPLSNEGLALRRAGTACDDRGELLVNFASDHSDEVREAAAELQPAGSSNMTYAVRAAIDDFTSDDFRGPPSSKRVLVFMGGEDECPEDATDEIRDELDRTGINAAFRLIALKVSGKELERLKAFKAALGPSADVEIRTPQTEQQLEDIMQQEVDEVADANTGASGPSGPASSGAGGQGGGGSGGGGSGATGP